MVLIVLLKLHLQLFCQLFGLVAEDQPPLQIVIFHLYYIVLLESETMGFGVGIFIRGGIYVT